MAPLDFVGARKDNTTNLIQHENLSTILYERFHNYVAWRSVIHNKGGTESNRKMNLTLIEEKIDSSDTVPLMWLRALAEIRDTKKKCLTIDSYM